MPLSPTDINSVANNLIATYQLENYPNIYIPATPTTPASGNMINAVTQADLYLEECYPDIYIGDLSNLAFNQIRELLSMCKLFQYYPTYWNQYQSANSVTKVQNSAGSSVTYSSNIGNSDSLYPSMFCDLYTKALTEYKKDIEFDTVPEVIASPADWCKDQYKGTEGSNYNNQRYYLDIDKDNGYTNFVNRCSSCGCINNQCNCNCC